MTSALIQPQIWLMYKTFLQQFPKPSVSSLASNCKVLAKKDMLHLTHLRKWVLETFIPVIAWSCIQHKPPAQGDRNTTDPAATCLCLPTQSFDADLQNPISVPHLLFLPPFREQRSIKQWGTSQLSPALRGFLTSVQGGCPAGAGCLHCKLAARRQTRAGQPRQQRIQPTAHRRLGWSSKSFQGFH